MKKALSVWLASAVVAAVTLGVPEMVAAQNTPAVGGTGGKAYTRRCPDNEVLVGFHAVFEGWLDLLKPRCRAVTANGDWTGSTRDLNAIGTYPALGFKRFGDVICPSGYAVKRFEAVSGWYVNAIKLTCHKLGSGARTQSTTSILRYLGNDSSLGYGPTNPTSHACGEAMPAVGVHGKSGNYVDSFGLVCGYILPTTPTLQAPGQGTDVTARRPTFRWDPVGMVTQPYTICINQTQGAPCSVSGSVKGTIRLPTASFTPPSDLPYQRGDIVYWRLEACNENGCRQSSRSFRFMP